MAYDIFDSFKKRLYESVDCRFDEIDAKSPDCGERTSKEDFFDSAFDRAYGISKSEDDVKTNLVEDYGNFPEWLIKFINKNKSVKERLTKMGLDLAHATFISGQLPRNARDPAFKDPSRIAVFRMVDSVGGNYEVIYIPGVHDPDVYPDENNRWTRYSASAISKKKLLELTKEYGYIDMNDSRNSNLALRKERADAKRDMVSRDLSAGQVPQRTNVQYAQDERGRTNWDKPISWDIKWVTKRGYDKSGYPLDPDKYGRMLDNVGLEDYSARLEMLYNKIEACRARLIALMNKFTAKDSMQFKTKSSWQRNIFGDIASIAQDFSRAIDAYRELEDGVQQVVNSTEYEDAEKGKRISYVFKWNGKRVRDYLTEVTEALKAAETAEKI